MTETATQHREEASLRPDDGDAGGKPVDPFARITLPVLRDAARKIAAEWRDTALDAPVTEAVEELVLMARALGDRALRGRIEPETPVAGVLRRRLLDLLQSEVVESWERGETPSPTEMLALLGSFDQLRQALDPKWDQRFASYLSAPTGLELLVEVAHDLRSPLTSILFLSEVLQKGQSGDVNDVQRRQLGIIYSAALGLISVASDLIEFSRGGDQLIDQEPSPFSVSTTLDSIVDIVQPLAEEKGLAVRIFPPATDQRIGYPVALNRVLLNLTTNALKFTDEGLVEIVARETGPSQVEFSVRDTGPGIDPDVVDSLYQPLRRSGPAQRYHFSGSGLGLIISRRLVEGMGSRLEFETGPRWGTRFYFELELPPAYPNLPPDLIPPPDYRM
jgi:signal transduction histidine kinase